MPLSAPHYCKEPGCNILAHTPRCEQHTRVHNKAKNQHDSAVKNAKGKFYKTTTWQRLRKQQLAKSPFCEWNFTAGPPCGRIARIVDHIVPREDGGKDTLDNFQSLCDSHHSKKEGSGGAGASKFI